MWSALRRHAADLGVADHDRPRIAAVEPAQQMEQRALSNTRRTHHRDHLALLDGKIQIAQDVETLVADEVALVDVLRGEKGIVGDEGSKGS